MVFANTQMGGMNFGFPDVCLTPIPTPAGPIPMPIPYPNMAMELTSNPMTASMKVFLGCMPAHTMMTTGTISNGDNMGVNMGVASGMVMGPHRHFTGAFTILTGGVPATRMLSMSGQNGMSLNIPGLALVPSQFKVIYLKP